ncbi:hypothetical protein [Caballeronia grimmiae]|uniref:hypothetical protein n=1 Tax=Caballeronia grimmiae TaxID=1071679 RepID=UPI0038BBFECB
MTTPTHDARVQFPAWPGESVTSIADMVARTSASRAVRTLLRRGIRRGALLYGSLPCRVQHFCEATSSAYGDEYDLLESHTLHRFATSGMRVAMEERVAENIVFGKVSRTMYPRLLPGLECGNRFGLQCPECAYEAARVVGRRISHVAHCIPYVTRCPWHGCKLICDCECSALEILLSQRRGKAYESNAIQYARSAWSINQRRSVGPIWPGIFAQLKEKGYVTSREKLRIQEFRAKFLSLFSAGFEDARLTQLATDWSAIERCIHGVGRPDRGPPASPLVLLEWAANDIEPIRPSSSRPRSNSAALVKRPELVLNRRQWLKNAETNASANRTELRRTALAEWLWLYKNDRQWLQENLRPACAPVNRRRLHELPQSVLSAISQNTVDMRDRAGGREPLSSAYQLRLAYGMNDYLFDRVTRALCPGINPAQRPAAREVFVSRRVQRATERSMIEGLQTDITSLSKKARLRVETVRKFSNFR